MEAKDRSIVIGEFVLDLERGALRRGEADVPLRPKSFEVLRYLAERPGRLVSKDELLEAIWAPAIVTEGALTQCVIDIRRALGDEAHAIVRTVPRRGFLLELPAVPGTELPPSAAALVRSPRAWVSGAVLLAAAVVTAWFLRPSAEKATGPATPTIAVLPFDDLSPAGDHQYLSDGIAEELLHALTGVAGLQVIARTSSFALRGQGLDAPTLGQRLNADYLLEGSVRAEDDRIRVTAQLIKASSGIHVWSQSFEQDRGQLLALQDEIARRVATGLDLQLRPDERPATAGRVQDHYLKGLFHYQRRSPGDLRLALAEFQRAVEADPGHARAWNHLSAVYDLLADESHEERPRLRGLQAEASARAVELAPDDPEVLMRAARALWETGQAGVAAQHWARARQLGKDNALVQANTAGFYHYRGKHEQALALERRALVLDPQNPVMRRNYLFSLMMTGNLAEARAEFERHKDALPEHMVLEVEATLAVREGRPGRARALAATLPPGLLRDSVLAQACRLPDCNGESEQALARLQAAAAEDPAKMGRLVETLAHRGETAAALRALEQVTEWIVADPIRARQDLNLINLRYQSMSGDIPSDPRWSSAWARIHAAVPPVVD